METGKKAINIITGRYGMGTSELNHIVDAIFGRIHARERFETYFHWYNLLHELGHGIMCFNADVRPHPISEEQIVNDFAVAYWLIYGENTKINFLDKIISNALENITCPAPSGVSHIEYAYEKWNTEDFHNFNNYGWFQFSCVKDSLRKRKNLEIVLTQMGVKNIKVQPKKTFIYPVIYENVVREIIDDAVSVLRKWGVKLPDTYVTFDSDPNKHMCNVIDL